LCFFPIKFFGETFQEKYIRKKRKKIDEKKFERESFEKKTKK